jgi:hypothetical protein
MDMRYLARQSAAYDMKLMLLTPPALLFQRGMR